MSAEGVCHIDGFAVLVTDRHLLFAGILAGSDGWLGSILSTGIELGFLLVLFAALSLAAGITLASTSSSALRTASTGLLAGL